MEISSTTWVPQWEMEDAPNFMDEFEMKYPTFDFSFDEFKFEQIGRGDFHELPAPSLAAVDGGEKRQKLAPRADSSSSSSHIISFESCMEPKIEMASYESDGNLKFSCLTNENLNSNQYSSRGSYGQGIKKVNRSNPLHAREHVIAERKRREKLSQRFIGLSALIPGLNKIDKASILGGAIRHVKELQDRLKMAEEQAATKSKTLKEDQQSAVYVKRTTRVSFSDDDTSSSDDNSFSGRRPVPEIEARISNKDVLIRIHCNKQKGCLSYLLNKIENNLNLTILNSSALPFAHSKLDITIVAKVDVGFCMTVEDVVKNLRQALLDFN